MDDQQDTDQKHRSIYTLARTGYGLRPAGSWNRTRQYCVGFLSRTQRLQPQGCMDLECIDRARHGGRVGCAQTVGLLDYTFSLSHRAVQSGRRLS